MRGDHRHWGGGEQVWYYRLKGETSGTGSLDPEQDESPPIDYALEDLFGPNGLWAHRFNGRVFQQNKDGRWGFVYYEKGTEGDLVASIANPPWSWNDHNDLSPAGEMATDPARFITRYAQGWGPVSTQYSYNTYLDIGG